MKFTFVSYINQLKRFKEQRENLIKEKSNNPVHLSLTLAKVIKKEVFDLSDTMDLLA